MNNTFLKKEAGYHLLLWILLIGPHGFFSAYLIEQHLDLLVYCVAVSDGLLILIIYFTIYTLIPKLFVRKKYLIFSIALLFLFAIYVAACLKMETDITAVLKRNHNTVHFASFYFINISRYTLIAFLLFRLNQHFEQKRKLQEVTLQKLQTEIKYLHAQINPHFLFNTLNNLYGLALTRSEKTADIILRLSKMMDYILYEVDGGRVPLSRDIENLENYIEMERIRQGNNAKILFQVDGVAAGHFVEPLLMLPLVENAFKHGVNQMINGAMVDMNLSITDSDIVFSVRNNYNSGANASRQLHKSLGIANLKKRLELFYPGRYSLEIMNDGECYNVRLTIEQERQLSGLSSELTEAKNGANEILLPYR